MPKTTKILAPSPVPEHDTSHADALIRAIEAASPNAKIRDQQRPDRSGKITITHLTVDLPVSSEGIDETSTASVDIDITPPLGTREGTLTFNGWFVRRTTYTLKAGEDLNAFVTKILARIAAAVESERLNLCKRVAQRGAEVRRQNTEAELRAAYPRAAAVLGYGLSASEVEIKAYLAVHRSRDTDPEYGCASGELMRVALAAIEAHLESKIADARRNARTVEQNLAWAEGLKATVAPSPEEEARWSAQDEGSAREVHGRDAGGSDAEPRFSLAPDCDSF